MGIPFIGDIISGVKDLVSEVVVDKDKRIEINYKLQELEDKASERYHEEMLAQIKVNETEAQHASVFVAGWRPAVGWIGATALGYSFVLNPFMEFLARVNGYSGAFPELPMEYIMTIMTGMLGFGALRTWEKAKGVESNSVSTAKPAAAPTAPTVEVKPSGEVVVQPPVAVPTKKKSKSIFKKIGKLI